MAKVPLTVFGVWFALSVWVEALSGIASLFIGGGLPPRFGFFARFLGPAYNSGATPGFVTHVTAFLVGVVLLFVAPWAMRLVVYLDRRMMHLLLSRDAGVVPGEEPRGVEIAGPSTPPPRLCAVSNATCTTAPRPNWSLWRCGLVRPRRSSNRLDAKDDDAEVQAIRRLVDEAHRGAKDAITDLRDLARGIHPPALDTGLENALATLASRSPVPTELTVSIPTRPSPAIEAICYFCAAELLANVAQHAHASSALSAALSTARG